MSQWHRGHLKKNSMLYLLCLDSTVYSFLLFAWNSVCDAFWPRLVLQADHFGVCLGHKLGSLSVNPSQESSRKSMRSMWAMEKNLVVQGKIRDYTIYLVMSWIIHQTGIRIPIFNHQYFMASIASHPAPLNQRLAFTQVLPWAVFSKEEAARNGIWKFTKKNHHVSDETPPRCFRLKSSNNFAMVGCQTAKVPREAVDAEVVESFQNEKLDYARDTQQVDQKLIAGRKNFPMKFGRKGNT